MIVGTGWILQIKKKKRGFWFALIISTNILQVAYFPRSSFKVGKNLSDTKWEDHISPIKEEKESKNSNK